MSDNCRFAYLLNENIGFNIDSKYATRSEFCIRISNYIDLAIYRSIESYSYNNIVVGNYWGWFGCISPTRDSYRRRIEGEIPQCFAQWKNFPHLVSMFWLFYLMWYSREIGRNTNTTWLGVFGNHIHSTKIQTEWLPT